MNEINLLKTNHLNMFDSKRREHKELVCNIYREYLSQNTDILSDDWKLFSGFYHCFAKKFPAEIYDNEYIVGTNWHWRWNTVLEKGIKSPFNRGHFIPDFVDFLNKGINGKIKDADSLPMGKYACEAMTAFFEYIRSYSDSAKEQSKNCDLSHRERLLGIAENCDYISENAPKSFWQALQLVWFAMCFLETECNNSAISFGRADAYLYPYYKNDIENGTLTRETAKKLIMCFCIKVSEGNESCMLTLGGDTENELTAIFLEAQTEITMRQPSVSLRVSDKTSKEILDKAKALTLTGCGMPAYFNDEVVINGLMRYGFTREEATDYGIVGCYEAAPCGIFSNTVSGNFYLYDSFDRFLSTADTYKTYDEFYNAYKKHYEEYCKTEILPGMKSNADCDFGFVSPFAYSLINRSFDKLLCGINILGIGILIDSLYTIKKLVFEEGYTTVAKLRTEAERNFENEELYRKIQSLEGHYGSNSPESNAMAREISRFIGEVILQNPISDKIVITPSLFLFVADIFSRGKVGNVNGRRSGELLSYGVMPCATPHRDNVTSALLSSANIDAEYFPDGCPTLITLNKKDISEGDVLNSFIKTYFAAGGFHIAINTVDADLLRKAKENPSEHSDVMVKISGYSTRFTGLCEEIQDAVIERA